MILPSLLTVDSPSRDTSKAQWPFGGVAQWGNESSLGQIFGFHAQHKSNKEACQNMVILLQIENCFLCYKR